MRTLLLSAFVVLLIAAPAAAQDLEGAQDHPVISRYPGSVIAWYHIDNHRPYRLATGPVTGYRHIDDWIDTEGRVTRIYYALDGGERTHSEVYANYEKALVDAGFEILAAGVFAERSNRPDVGSRKWQGVFFGANPWAPGGAVGKMVSGSATSGGSGTVIGRKERAAGTVYVAVSVCQYSTDNVSTLIDVVEVAAAETGLVAVDAEAIGKGIAEHGRMVLDGLYFDHDQATLKPESGAALDQIAAFLKAQPERNFYVVGHTDARGEFAYNQGLSAERARAVVEALVKDFGIASRRLVPHGVGPLVPVFANGTDAGRARNRRVELVER